MRLLAATTPPPYHYPHPIPGFIFAAIVMTALISWVVWIYIHNFGPAAKLREAAARDQVTTRPPD
jgi:hypothetical protein